MDRVKRNRILLFSIGYLSFYLYCSLTYSLCMHIIFCILINYPCDRDVLSTISQKLLQLLHQSWRRLDMVNPPPFFLVFPFSFKFNINIPCLNSVRMHSCTWPHHPLLPFYTVWIEFLMQLILKMKVKLQNQRVVKRQLTSRKLSVWIIFLPPYRER